MTDYDDYLTFIDSQYEHMKQLVVNWSAINSGSYHLEGLERMRKALADNFLWLDGVMEEVELAPMQQINSRGELVEVPLGKALRITKRPEAKHRIFLCGHYDTVFGKDHPFQAPIVVDNDTINGPGVADLKGGLVVMLKALETLERSPYATEIGWEVLLNPDEEIGSPGSDALLKEAASRNHVGLIYEPSLPDGALVSDRKGSGNFSLSVRGKSAHAGRDHHLGRNAIAKLAEAVLLLNGLNGQQEGVTVNPGIIEGGTTVNTVPDLAILRFNIRVKTLTEQEWVVQQLEQIMEQLQIMTTEGYQFSLHGAFTRPPKQVQPRDHALWNGIISSGQMLGLTIAWKESGGCCDGNNLAAYGLSNIDTLGVRGGNIHSDKEFMLFESLKERAKLSALFLMRLGAGEITL